MTLQGCGCDLHPTGVEITGPDSEDLPGGGAGDLRAPGLTGWISPHLRGGRVGVLQPPSGFHPLKAWMGEPPAPLVPQPIFLAMFWARFTPHLLSLCLQHGWLSKAWSSWWEEVGLLGHQRCPEDHCPQDLGESAGRCAPQWVSPWLLSVSLLGHCLFTTALGRNGHLSPSL